MKRVEEGDEKSEWMRLEERYKGIPSCPPPSDPSDHRGGQQTLASSQSLLISLLLAAGHLSGVTVCLILGVCVSHLWAGFWPLTLTEPRRRVKAAERRRRPACV